MAKIYAGSGGERALDIRTTSANLLAQIADWQASSEAYRLDAERLRAALHKAIAHMEDGESHDEGAFDDSCNTCVLLNELRSIAR